LHSILFYSILFHQVLIESNSSSSSPLMNKDGGMAFPMGSFSMMNNLSDDELYTTFSPPLDAETLITSNFSSEEYPDLAVLDVSSLGLFEDSPSEPSDSLIAIKIEPHVELETLSPVLEIKKEPIEAKTQLERSAKRSKTLTQEPIITKTNQKCKREAKYVKRLIANKKSAQASRERKKVLKVELEKKLKLLREENSHLSTTITELETENKLLKSEFVHLQGVINDSAALSKILTRANMESLPKIGNDSESYPGTPKLMASNLNTAALMYLLLCCTHSTNTSILLHST